MSATAAGNPVLALLPVENLLEGSVSEVMQALGMNHHGLQPVAEMLVPVTHSLMVRSDKGGSEPEIHVVMSHPQALAQCREKLLGLYGGQIRQQVAASTSEAARLLSEGVLEPGTAVIASPMAAELYGLTIICSDISDVPDNLTRFLLVSTRPAEYRGLFPLRYPQKTSFCLAFPDRPGGLVEVLLVFRQAGVNLTRIESRPSRKRMGEYVFYLDAAMDVTTHPDLLARLKALTTYCHVLGPYACLGNLDSEVG